MSKTPSSGTPRHSLFPLDYAGQLVTRHFKSLEEYSEATKQERHSILVDYDVFVKVNIPDKTDPQRLYKPEAFDFRLRGDSAPVDQGVLLPSINDDFTGPAPDLGAYERDRLLPHYGPRAPTDASVHSNERP